jgi:predicted kinase
MDMREISDMGYAYLMKTTTLTLADDLIQAIESEARHTGRAPDQVIERVLREALLAKAPAKPYKLRWLTVEGHLQPGVDLDDRSSLIDRMENRS